MPRACNNTSRFPERNASPGDKDTRVVHVSMARLLRCLKNWTHLHIGLSSDHRKLPITTMESASRTLLVSLAELADNIDREDMDPDDAAIMFEHENSLYGSDLEEDTRRVRAKDKKKVPTASASV